MKNQVFNPYLPSWEYVPDGEPRVFGDRLYVYGSHDLFNGENFCLGDYVCWSAPVADLSDWRYEGVIYRQSQHPGFKKTTSMNAPDVVQGKDGRYYLYYQINGEMSCAVAVCDTPAGKYAYLGHVRHPDGTAYGTQKNDPFCFDPGVLVDDDGEVYLYVGFYLQNKLLRKLMQRSHGIEAKGCYCLKLESDMLTVKGTHIPVLAGRDDAVGTPFEGHSFYEASSPRKIDGKYYLIYSSELSHELCYAVSDYPDRDFRYGGILVSIGDVGYRGRKSPNNYTGNTHGGMVEINGQWYIFYHRQTNKQKCARQGCAEKVTILPNGFIPQVEITSCGLNPAALKGEGSYEARIACNLSGAQGTFAYLKTHEKDKKKLHPYFTQTGTDREENGDQYIANMKDGAYAGFKYFAFDGLRSISVSVRGEGSGSMEVRTKLGGKIICVIPVQQTAQWMEFTASVSSEVHGEQALYFTYSGTGYLDFNLFVLDR